MRRITIAGAGAWGTALAMHAARTGLDVTLFGRKDAGMDRLLATRTLGALPGASVPGSVRITFEVDGAFDGADAILWSVPVQATASELKRLEQAIPAGVPLVSTSKGIEIGTGRRTTEIIRQVATRAGGIAVLSGPTFAAEVARGLPTAAVIASEDAGLSTALQELLSSPTFRFYRSSDVIGVEISGAAKNVVAIAAGITDGLELGQNTRAALLTRALAEIRRLGMKLGGVAETFAGLACAGDLILTATGDLSRNRQVGLALARGKSLDEALASLGGAVAEGVPTATSLVELARSAGAVMPIAEAIQSILSGEMDPRAAVKALMTRELKDERI
jgi:glycerol-3-phosphate dehydrogenase (NAD(P)+)